MAANLQSNRALANLGKRFAARIRPPQSLPIHPLSLTSRRVHVSAYDKNPEDNVNPTIVPDHVMPQQPEQYWAPHPRTGVFGPATDDNPGSGQESSIVDDSVLEQKAFFRPQEDLDKPPVQP